jgi:hypothetical protein
VHDFYARSEFLNHITMKNAEVRDQMENTAKFSAVEEQVIKIF